MLVLTGPTACGKTDIGLALARRMGGEIVCADAFQLYAGLPVLTAQPTAADRAEVPHHLYGTVPLTEEMDAARYARIAEACVAEIEGRDRLAIVTGGSGLYIKALTHGLSPLPPADAPLRVELEALTAEERTARLLALDPVAGETVPLSNPRYVQRALEIAILTGRPVAEQRTSFQSGPRAGIRGIFLQRDRAELYDRINARTLAMMEHGALEEVRALTGDLSATAEKTIGLRELRAVLAGGMSMADAISAIQQTTRRYAKRQETWFRRETWMETVECGGRSAEEIAEIIPDRSEE
jgi:tRNA dimethylallyltransferase